MKPFVQRLLLPFGKPIIPQRWIFILGCYNSGTTLLANILRQHPIIEGLPNEGAFLTDALPYPEQFGWPRMWAECLDQVLLPSGSDTKERADRIKRHWSLWYPRNPRNVVEKSISNVTRINFLNNHFQPAYFIHIIRNGYAVAKGIQKKAKLNRWHNVYRKTEYPIEICANQWRLSAQLCDKAYNDAEKIFVVSYEKLTEDPINTLNKITQFLNLRAIPSELIDKKWNIHGITSSIKNMNKKHLKSLSKVDINKINAIAEKELLEYGYFMDN